MYPYLKQGYLDIDLLLNCNKIKSLSVNKENIVSAVKLSSMVELNSENTKVRRVGNKPLPELKLLSKKRKADDDLNEAALDEENALDP